MDAVVARNVSKTFGRQMLSAFGRGRPVAALTDVSLAIREGEIFGLLGPNGAGKTTLIAILIGLTTPDAGTVEVCGLDVRRHLHQVQQRVNLVRGFSGVLEKFTTWEMLSYYAMLYGVPRSRVQEVMALAGIADKRDAQVSLFSSGWRQRFFIAKGTINKPRVLFMDEPTVGLDVDAALAVRELIADLNRQGCTILLTTHYMREAEELCDRIALISQGRIVAEGTAAELKEQVKQDEAIIIHGRLDPPLRERLGRLPGVLGVAQDEDSVRLLVEHRRAMGPVLETLAEGKVRLESVRFDRPSLEEVFLKLTHQGLEQGDE
ncbi:MAG: ABC transporter ATP-binding protein [Holophaga sp.]|jgi:ABC-2 type transport system ATP-binding protein